MITAEDLNRWQTICERTVRDEIEVIPTVDSIETSICGPIKARFSRDNERMRMEAEANAERLVVAWNAMPALIQEVERLQETLKEIDVLVHMGADA